MTDDPMQFTWSSCAHLCGQRDDPLLQPHPAYARLGASRVERATAYQALLRETLTDDDLQAVRAYLQQQRAWGRDAFQAMVEAKTCRFAGIRPAHHPRAIPNLGK